MGHRRLAPVLACGLLMLSASAQAGETITYTYDVHGRLVSVAHSGTVNNGKSTSYVFDKADNRSHVAAGTGVILFVENTSAVEASNMVFTITKVGATGSNVTVNYATAHGTAGGFDYMAKSGSLTFTPSETSKTVTVTTYTDSFAEADETLTLNLSNASGATIAGAQGVGTIIDND